MAAGGLPISLISSIPSELSLSDPLLVPAVTWLGMVARKEWELIATGEGVAVMEVGVTSTGLRDKGIHVSVILGDGGVL